MEYLRAFLQDRNVATIVGTSAYAANKILRTADVDRARTVVEYGAGNGVLTRQILRRLPADASLISLETNARLAATLELISDERLTIYRRSAAEIEEIIEAHVDVVISGIPFSLLPDRNSILDSTARVLRPEGRFVAYQVTPRLFGDLRTRYQKVDADLTFLNIPPLFIVRGSYPLR